MKINTKFSVFTLLTMLLSVGSSFGQAETHSFSLSQARVYAVAHSYSTRKAVLDKEMAEKKVKETTAMGLPQIGASADFKNFLEIPTSLAPDFANPSSSELVPIQFGTNYNLGGSLMVNQLLFNGSYIVGLQAAKVYRDMSEKVLMKSEREIKDDVTRAYGNVIISVENFETIKGNKSYLEQTLKETQALYESGFAKEQDVDQLTILVQTARIEYNRADRLRGISDNFLKFTMGIPASSSLVLTDSLESIVTYGNDSSIVDQPFDVNAHIDYKIAISNQELQKLNLKNTKVAFLPTLNGFFQYQQNYQYNDMSLKSDFWFPTSVWGLSLNVPIFSSGERMFVKQQADLNWQKSQVDTKMAEEGLMVEFLTKKSEYQFAVDQYKNSKDNLDLVQKIVTKETIKYQEGMSSSLNLANAQIQFFQIQGAYVQSIMQMINARSAMDRILSNY
ncbi:MAG: outer membrane protein TolC [Dokdonia sp.]|jgi:outer membrane protein TolC